MKLIYEQYVDVLKSTNPRLILKESKIPCLDLLCSCCPYVDLQDCHSLRIKDFDATVAYYQKAYPEDFL
jgi:hypothetical protein